MTQEYQETITFAQLDLDGPILRAVEKLGFSKPTPIQQRVIPLVLEGKDVVGQAHTGTGKTAAFGLPAVQYVSRDSGTKVLVLTPVRELASQICDELYQFGSENGVQIVAIHGGKSYSHQIDKIRSGAQIVVATPGRLLDLLESNKMGQFRPTLIVIDEADEMLDQGFLEDVKAILKFFPHKRQTLLFSATMPEPIKELAKGFLKEPVFVHIAGKERTNASIEQFYCLIKKEEREDALVRLLDTRPTAKAIVFCNTKKEVDHLTAALIHRGHQALALHGDMEQPQRQRVIGLFKKYQQGILVATEVAARGLNMEDVSHVFNYELPYGSDSYVHRIGRTGRGGKEGQSITFVLPREYYAFERICKTLNAKAQCLPIPSLEEAKGMKLALFVQQLHQICVAPHAEELVNHLEGELSLREIACRLAMLTVKEDSASGPDKIGIDIKTWNHKEDRKGGKKEEFFKKRGRRDTPRRDNGSSHNKSHFSKGHRKPLSKSRFQD